MIKVAVWGAESNSAGELIRILLLHPEVELMSVSSETLQGQTIQSHHYGLTGEREIRFVATPDLQNIDVLFITGPIDKDLLQSLPEKYPDLKIVDLADNPIRETTDPQLTAPGLSEIFRKNLVRGAKYSYILPPAASIVLIALFPLAKNLLLNKGLRIKVECQENLLTSELEKRTRETISEILGSIQQSFEEDVEIDFRAIHNRRGMKINAMLRCTVSLEEIKNLYEGIYDDHNFTFLVDRPAEIKDVAGTQKCLIHLSKPEEDILAVEAVADPTMRGDAGEGIHVMNLLLGLYEKIGLTFRAI